MLIRGEARLAGAMRSAIRGAQSGARAQDDEDLGARPGAQRRGASPGGCRAPGVPLGCVRPPRGAEEGALEIPLAKVVERTVRATSVICGGGGGVSECLVDSQTLLPVADWPH